MSDFNTVINAINSKAQSLATSTTSAEDLVYLGKTVESLRTSNFYSINYVAAENKTVIDPATAITGSGTLEVEGDTNVTVDLNVGGGITTGGSIFGPTNFVIDPAVHGDDTGTLIVKGNLQVEGTSTTLNSTSLSVADLNITVAEGASNAAAADGAGITVDGASASMSYAATTDSFVFNKDIQATYAVLHPKAYDITTELDMNKPTQFVTITADTTFTEVNKDKGKVSILVLQTGGFTPTFSSNIKWPGDNEPIWSDNNTWVLSFIGLNSSTLLAVPCDYSI